MTPIDGFLAHVGNDPAWRGAGILAQLVMAVECLALLARRVKGGG
jgi:hypothetical protein